jgi:hypothetical protein
MELIAQQFEARNLCIEEIKNKHAALLLTDTNVPLLPAKSIDDLATLKKSLTDLMGVASTTFQKHVDFYDFAKAFPLETVQTFDEAKLTSWQMELAKILGDYTKKIEEESKVRHDFFNIYVTTTNLIEKVLNYHTPITLKARDELNAYANKATAIVAPVAAVTSVAKVENAATSLSSALGKFAVSANNVAEKVEQREEAEKEKESGLTAYIARPM